MTSTKMSKDQLQKLILSGIGLVGLVYVYFQFFLGPLDRSRTTAETTIASLQEKLAGSTNDLQSTADLERQASSAMARFAAYQALSPEGAPIAWFPPRIRSFFADQQIDRAGVKLEGTSDHKEPALASWSRQTWAIDLPQVDFATLGDAIAALENREPLLQVSKISIRAVAEDLQFQQAMLTVHTTLPKR